ncbi:hypothetical protein [Streptomyces spectabilis]|nr:hypothetical protein [Streptomyces spectabilis]MBB5104640.1 hypothetical protein [Streptomyces spectabilis]MCI3905007.1 hypothetical protein [Streptomyces spectabilis]GGV01262.1 membrane protein [Streptomyces spectabilis]
MRRSHRLLPALLLVPLALTGCGSDSLAGTAPPDRSELEERATAAQTVVEHVYVTEADGFELARQSVGVIGEDGFQSTYVKDEGGAQLTLSVDRGTVTDGNCRTVPPAAKSCEKDGKGWYRVTGSRHEYVRSENGLRIQLAADRGAVDRAALRAAAETAHRADDRELDATLPEQADPEVLPPDGGGTGLPADRGDLPPNGDGAPQDPPGTSG